MSRPASTTARNSLGTARGRRRRGHRDRPGLGIYAWMIWRARLTRRSRRAGIDARVDGGFLRPRSKCLTVSEEPKPSTRALQSHSQTVNERRQHRSADSHPSAANHRSEDTHRIKGTQRT